MKHNSLPVEVFRGLLVSGDYVGAQAFCVKMCMRFKVYCEKLQRNLRVGKIMRVFQCRGASTILSQPVADEGLACRMHGDTCLNKFSEFNKSRGIF